MCSALFFFVLILPGRRRTLNLQMIVGCPGVSRYALRCERQLRAILVVMGCLGDVMHVFMATSSPLVSAVSLASSSHPPAHGHRFCTTLVVLLLCSSFKAFSAPQLVLRHCVQYVQLRFIQALASAQLIILLIKGFSAHLRYHCRRFGLSTAN